MHLDIVSACLLMTLQANTRLTVFATVVALELSVSDGIKVSLFHLSSMSSFFHCKMKLDLSAYQGGHLLVSPSS